LKQDIMPHTLTYRAALAAIWDRSGYDRGFISDPFAGDDAARRGLARTAAVLAQREYPQDRVHLIHVAGSKGKGSTTVLIDAILRAAGYRSGRFTSPHLHTYRERFVVDNQMIGEKDFASLTADVLAAVDAVEAIDPGLGRLTAFELTTAMAFEWFARSGCSVAVIEVGLGGTLDATNVIDPVISTITRLDLEHTAILGDTLAGIASNKAGIIKPGRPVVTVSQDPEALAVIADRAREVNSQLLIGKRDWFIEGDEDGFAVRGPWGTIGDLRTSLVGQHQVENAALAVATLMTMPTIGQEIGERAIRDGLARAEHPGRFERVKVNDATTIVIDGAHTPVAAQALNAALARHFPDHRPVIVVGMLQDKHPEHFLAPMIDRAESWVVVEPESPRAMSSVILATPLGKHGQPVRQAPSVAAGIDVAISTGAPLVVVTGSLSTAAEARVHLGLAINDPSPS
jgi:dihydrofolate synthase / folylpolyglutamate synthase